MTFSLSMRISAKEHERIHEVVSFTVKHTDAVRPIVDPVVDRPTAGLLRRQYSYISELYTSLYERKGARFCLW